MREDPIEMTATLTGTMTCDECYRQSSYTVQEWMTESQFQDMMYDWFDNDGWDFETSLCEKCHEEKEAQ